MDSTDFLPSSSVKHIKINPACSHTCVTTKFIKCISIFRWLMTSDIIDLLLFSPHVAYAFIWPLLEIRINSCQKLMLYLFILDMFIIIWKYNSRSLTWEGMGQSELCHVHLVFLIIPNGQKWSNRMNDMTWGHNYVLSNPVLCRFIWLIIIIYFIFFQQTVVKSLENDTFAGSGYHRSDSHGLTSSTQQKHTFCYTSSVCGVLILIGIFFASFTVLESSMASFPSQIYSHQQLLQSLDQR